MRDKYTVADLIHSLQGKDQTEEVEALVCTKDGKILVMVVETKASDMTKALKIFGGGK